MMRSTSAKKEGGLRTVGLQKKTTNSLPLISIITVVLNGDRYLEQSILSVLSQTYLHLELIIIDGGSTDLSLDVIKKYENRIDYWISEPDKGIYDAINKGIAFAKGELIGLLHADDFYESTTVEIIVKNYQVAPRPLVFYGNTHIIRENLNLRYSLNGHLKYWKGMCFCHQAMFVHRDVYLMLGYYDSSLRIAGDYDFVIKAITRGVQFSQIDAFLVNYRDSGISSQNQLISMFEGRKVLKRYVSLMSWKHIIYLLLLGKSVILLTCHRILKLVCGKQIAVKASRWYLMKFIRSVPKSTNR